MIPFRKGHRISRIFSIQRHLRSRGGVSFGAGKRHFFFVGGAAARGSRSAHTRGGSGLLAPACHISRPRAACKGRGRGRVACVVEVRGRRAQAPRAWRSGALRAPRRAACTPAAAAAGPPTRARPGSGEEGSRARRRAPGGACRNITGHGGGDREVWTVVRLGGDGDVRQ